MVEEHMEQIYKLYAEMRKKRAVLFWKLARCAIIFKLPPKTFWCCLLEAFKDRFGLKHDYEWQHVVILVTIMQMRIAVERRFPRRDKKEPPPG